MGKEELWHFAEEKFKKSGDLGERKPMFHSYKGLTSCSSMAYTISKDETVYSASTCRLHSTWMSSPQNGICHYVIDSHPKPGLSSPLVGRHANHCPIAWLRARTGIGKQGANWQLGSHCIHNRWSLWPSALEPTFTHHCPCTHCSDHSSLPLGLWTPLIWLGLLGFISLGLPLPHSLDHSRIYKEERRKSSVQSKSFNESRNNLDLALGPCDLLPWAETFLTNTYCKDYTLNTPTMCAQVNLTS